MNGSPSFRRGALAALWTGASLLGVACSAASPTPPAVEPPTPTTTAAPVVAPAAPPRPRDRFAVASENATGVEVARQVLERGGSAADATVAGVLVACTAHPSSCGLGGGGVSVVVGAGEPFAIDFRETAPHGLRRADHLGKAPPSKRRGVMVGVPGLVAGLWQLHQRAGKLPWADVVGAAADVAERGFPLSPYMAQAFSWNAAWIRDDAAAKRIALGDGESRVGETQKNARLADVLRKVAKDGAPGFYQGTVAEDVVKTAREAGGRLTLADLARYRAEVRPALAVAWGDRVVVSAPPPAAGGVLVAQVLGFVTPADLSELGWASGALVHVLAEAVRAAHADRTLFLGDPDFTKMDVGALVDGARLRARRAKVRMDATTLPKLPSIAEGGTLHFVAVDDAGLVVSTTATLTSMFGAKLVTSGGFALNDALTDFTADEYGQRAATRGPNFPRGGARPTSSLTPVVVLAQGAPVLALGGSGGLRAPNAVAQVILAHLGAGKPLAEAVSAPRVHVTSAGALRLEEGLRALEPDLLARGEVIERTGPSFASVVAVALRAEGGVRVLEPVFDPRKGGAVTVGRDEGGNRPTRAP